MSNIKSCFTSRYGEEGRLVQVDFSQLEVVCLAILADDEVLQDELENGEDIHHNNACLMFNTVNPTKEERRRAKEFTFQLQYGAGAGSISKRMGIPSAEAKMFIDKYYEKYKGIKEYHDDLIEDAKDNNCSVDKKSVKGYPLRATFMYCKPTSRLFYHEQKDKPEWLTWTKEETTFSPTELKNYAVQGFAGGDIVPLANAMLYRTLLAHPEISSKAKLVNTVHDNSISDVHVDVMDDFLKLLVRVYDSVTDRAKELFLINWKGVKFKYDIEVGKNLQDMKPINPTYFLENKYG